jgi:HSP20 family protein
MYRRRDRLMVAVALPGTEPEDIEVEVTADGRLALRGRMRGPLESDDEILLDEWNAGPYERDLQLPLAVDGELANVTYSNGVLVAALPIADNVRPARLHMDIVGSARGERVGSHGHPAQPATSDEHHRRGETPR